MMVRHRAPTPTGTIRRRQGLVAAAISTGAMAGLGLLAATVDPPPLASRLASPPAFIADPPPLPTPTVTLPNPERALPLDFTPARVQAVADAAPLTVAPVFSPARPEPVSKPERGEAQPSRSHRERDPRPEPRPQPAPQPTPPPSSGGQTDGQTGGQTGGQWGGHRPGGGRVSVGELLDRLTHHQDTSQGTGRHTGGTGRHDSSDQRQSGGREHGTGRHSRPDGSSSTDTSSGHAGGKHDGGGRSDD